MLPAAPATGMEWEVVDGAGASISSCAIAAVAAAAATAAASAAAAAAAAVAAADDHACGSGDVSSDGGCNGTDGVGHGAVISGGVGVGRFFWWW